MNGLLDGLVADLFAADGTTVTFSYLEVLGAELKDCMQSEVANPMRLIVIYCFASLVLRICLFASHIHSLVLIRERRNQRLVRCKTAV